MNSVIIMAFTEKGHKLADTIAGRLARDGFSASVYTKPSLNELVPSVFKKGNILIFIGAAGIAVRAISGLIKDKTSDPAVLVIDELARYVIPILSGHIGGANRFAASLAGIINAIPVITTATDINGVFQIDVYAEQNGYKIANPGCIKYISAALLEGAEVCLHTPFEVCGALPAGITLKAEADLGIFIAPEEYEAPFKKELRLIPKRYHVGVGAKKGIPFDTLNALLSKALSKKSIPADLIGTISTISLKKDEHSIIRLCERYGVKLTVYPPERLKEYEGLFECSEFVRSVTGVGNVCETAAYLSSGKGEIIVGKMAWRGATIAIAAQNWRVEF